MNSVFVVFDESDKFNKARSIIGVAPNQSVAIDIAFSYESIRLDCEKRDNPRAYCALCYTEQHPIIKTALSH